MSSKPVSDDVSQPGFADESERPSEGILRELFNYLISNRKWILVPIVVALLCLSLLMVISSTAAAPFIYTIF